MPSPAEKLENRPPANEKHDTGDKLLDFILDEYIKNKCGDKSVVKAPKTQDTCKALEKAILDYNDILRVYRL